MESATKNGTIYEFDEFRLIPGEELLLRNGEPVPLNPKAFRVLTLLVERNGHLIQKSEILDLIWEGSFVEEGSLSKAIWFVRQALGDTSKERFIQTVPRRGYRFVFPVCVVTEPSGAFRLVNLPGLDEPETALLREDKPPTYGGGETADTVAGYSTASAATARRSLSFRAWVTLGALTGIIVIATAGGYCSFIRKASSVSARSIAVLPVFSINASDRHDLFEVGIADAVINYLSSAESLRIRPLSAVREYGKPKDPSTVGREQKVDYVLISNYQLADGKIKVTAQLHNVESGAIEYTYTSPPKIATDLFAVQEAIAADLGNNLMQRLGVVASRSIKKRGTSNEEAYRLFIQGRQLYHQLSSFRADGERASAVDVLKEAVALDPNFAEAWATLALAYIGRSTSQRKDGTERQGAIDAIKKAIEVDPNLSDAYSAKCFAETHFEFDLGGAETACRRALELDPNSGYAHRYFATVLTTLGRHDEAISEMKTAIDLEPTSAGYQRILGNVLYYARRFDEAATQYKRCIGLAPDDPNNYENVIKTLEVQKKDVEAFEYLLKWVTVQGKDEATIESLRTAYAKDGYRGVLLERIKISDRVFLIAGMYAQLGDNDMALVWLERAYERHAWQLAFLEMDPQFDSLRDDTRYADLVRRIRKNNV
jgi:DNA-binding winged helix-turn-helix (wHTH) protein/tetratricopeptide (TPR) repeat protein